MKCVTVWIGSWFLSISFSIFNPLVEGVWNTMLRAMCSFFLVGHISGAILDEWIEIIVAEAFVHVRERCFGQVSVDRGILKGTL